MNRYAVAAVLSGAFFGLTGLFTRTLTGAGLSTMGILTIRCSVAALCFFCTALGDIRQLKMHKKDFWLFAAVGILGQGMFSFCYYNAINMMSISTACILMYLSPVFVTIMAHFVFKDGISRRTVLAIILCIAGCACVSGFGGTMTLLGLICGLGSAIAFALINILTRALLGRGYTGKAVNFWICAFAALFGIVMDLLLFREGFSRPFAVLFSGWKIFLVGITMALTTGFLAYRFFSLALHGCKSGTVSILASSEPVVETLVSVFVFREPFGVLCVVGIVLVLAGIVLQNTASKTEASAQ